MFGLDHAMAPDAVFGSALVQWRKLLNLLLAVFLAQAGQDDFLWRLNNDGVFSVVSLSDLVSESMEIAWQPTMIRRLNVLWKLKILLKIKIFAWRMFTFRLPSKDMLIRRGIANISSNQNCVFCNCHPESMNYLFYLCQFSKAMWERIYIWLGDDVYFSIEDLMNFDSIQEKVKNVFVRENINNI